MTAPFTKANRPGFCQAGAVQQQNKKKSVFPAYGKQEVIIGKVILGR
jgi:hypothetical protein